MNDASGPSSLQWEQLLPHCIGEPGNNLVPSLSPVLTRHWSRSSAVRSSCLCGTTQLRHHWIAHQR